MLILRPPDANSQLIEKKLWWWERLKAGEEGDDREWDGLMVSLTQWTWVCVDSRNWWSTGSPGMLRFMWLQRVRHDRATELNWLSQIKEPNNIIWTQVQSLGRGDLLEKEMAIHSTILAWKIPWMEKPGRLQSMGSQRVRHDWATWLYLL